MAIINQRWPRNLAPQSCIWGRTRNDVAQISPRTRETSVIRQGRPLWTAECTWRMANTDRLAHVRYLLDALDGFVGSVQLWDFSSPYPFGINLATTGDVEPQRLYWSYLTETYNFDWNGLPSHWALDATANVLAPAAIGATSFTLYGLDASTLAAVQGQYVQLGRRLYVVAANVSSDGDGEATITLTTPLIDALAPDDEARFTEAGCEMRLADQNFKISASAGDGLISVSASFIETVTDYS